jgi:hypothetical protein
MPDPRSSHAVGVWNLVENLFRTLDSKKSGVLRGQDAQLFNEKLIKLKVMDLDPEAVSDLRALADSDAGITIDSFTAVVLRGEQRQQHELRSKVPAWLACAQLIISVLIKCFQEDGHIVPGRFQQVVGFHEYSVTAQHPCYTTSSRDLGKKKPQVIFYCQQNCFVRFFKISNRL